MSMDAPEYRRGRDGTVEKAAMRRDWRIERP
jgi:hypothetical protein